VPGNNDIWSSEAYDYKTIPASKTTNISLTEFADIYQEFGFNEAIYEMTTHSVISVSHRKICGYWG
jgi:hypothetical protein